MKFRKDFVTNSSSSSYTCDICGATESGWDISLEEAGMVECVNGHTICNDEQVDYSDTTFDAIVRSLSSIVVTTTPDQSDKVPIVQIIDSE